MGSTRQGRFSEKAARWIFEQVKATEGVEAELIDLRDYPLPFFDEPESPMRLKGNYTHSEVLRWAAKVTEADAYIIVTPEYNHGYPAVLKNALDSLYAEWAHKPVGFVAYGNVGGARSVEQLRQVIVELQMVSIKNALHIPPPVYMAAKKADEQSLAASFEPLNEKVSPFLNELEWWARALKTARGQNV